MPATTSKKSYIHMATEAIVSLKERTGSSSQKIKGSIVAKYPELVFAQVRQTEKIQKVRHLLPFHPLPPIHSTS